MAKASKREIRAFAETPLYKRIAAEAARMRVSLGNYLLLAAAEKLARDERPDGDKEAA